MGSSTRDVFASESHGQDRDRGDSQDVCQVSDSVCSGSPVVIEKENEYLVKAEVDKRGGVMYRQCVRENKSPGMCSSLRMMAIACSDNPVLIEMRKRQIAENVGNKCDPKYETWLGCASS